MNTTQRIALTWTAVFIAFIGAFFAYQKVSGWMSSDARFLRKAEKEFAELNTRLPMQVDEVTRLDSMKIESVRTWLYYYTVEQTDEILSLGTGGFEEVIRKSAPQTIKTNLNLNPKNKLGVTFKYFYASENREWTAEVVITPDMYE